MGWDINLAFRALDDADGTGAMLDLPYLTIHPNTATSIVPDITVARLYPYNDDHQWYAMKNSGDYGPLLIGVVPSPTFTPFPAADTWFTGLAELPDDAGDRQYGFSWLATTNVTDDDHASDYVGHFFQTKINVAAGKTLFADNTQHNAYFAAYRIVDEDEGTIEKWINVLVESGHWDDGSHNTPATDRWELCTARMYNDSGQIDEFWGYRVESFAGSGTVDLAVAYFADAYPTDPTTGETVGWWATNDQKDIWEFQESDIIIAPATNLELGSGRNYVLTSDNNYNIDGFTAGANKRDGEYKCIYNGNSSFAFTIIDNNLSGSAATHNQVLPTTSGNLTLAARRMLHLVYRTSLFSGAGGWIAWVT